MPAINRSNGGATTRRVGQEANHGAPDTSELIPRGSRGSGGSGGSSGRGSGGGSGGPAIPNRGDTFQDTIVIDPFPIRSDFHHDDPVLPGATGGGGGGGGGFGETPVPAMDLQGQHWEPMFRGLALLCVWGADSVASRVESPGISSLVRDLCVQASFAVPFGALHGLHRWGLIDEATRADIAGVMPTWDAAWIVFATRDPHAGATDGGHGSGGGETLPGGDGGGGGRRHHAGRRGGLIWRVLFWWVVRLGLAVVDYFLGSFVGGGSPSVSTMLRDWCKPVAESLLFAFLRDLHLSGAVDWMTWEDIAARLPGWYNGA
eukprot:g13260.t1